MTDFESSKIQEPLPFASDGLLFLRYFIISAKIIHFKLSAND